MGEWGDKEIGRWGDREKGKKRVVLLEPNNMRRIQSQSEIATPFALHTIWCRALGSQ
jgi:hypothetical protein